MTFENAQDYCFSILHPVRGNVTSEKNGEMRASRGWQHARQEVVQEVLAAGGDSSVCNETWVRNHYGLVVWKLASYERKFPLSCHGIALTFERVVAPVTTRRPRVNANPGSDRCWNTTRFRPNTWCCACVL